VNLLEVNTPDLQFDFLEVARVIYTNDDNWICPLDVEIESIFNPKENSFFDHGEAIRWVLKSSDGRLIGRIAAFINTDKAYSYDQPTGGCGFFECVDDKKYAFLLFDTAKKWLSDRGMQAMDGPINFGENDNYWGLLVDGFMPPAIGMPYNHTYYKMFFEEYGFKTYYEQYSYNLDLGKKFPERFWKIAEWVAKKPDFTFEHFDFSNQKKYIDDIVSVYDQAWEFHDNYTPINKADLEKIASDGKDFIDPDLIWFAYHDSKPIAFFVMMPDVNQLLTKIDGRLNWWSKLKLYYHLRVKTISRARITIMGVVPKFQRYGIESAVFWYVMQALKEKKQYKEVELSWVGDFNPKMVSIYEKVGGVKIKTHITYRCMFDPEAKYSRLEIIPLENRTKNKKKEACV